MMLTNPEATIVFAGFGERFLTVVQSVLFAGFTDLRHQLEADEGKLVGHLARLAGSLGESLKHPLRVTIGAKIVDAGKKLFAKYGTEIREDVVREMRKGTRELKKSYQQTAAEVTTIEGPRSSQSRAQVRAVILALAESKDLSIADACKASFRFIEGGYANEHQLYVWCHRNESKVRNLADQLRLENF